MIESSSQKAERQIQTIKTLLLNKEHNKVVKLIADEFILPKILPYLETIKEECYLLTRDEAENEILLNSLSGFSARLSLNSILLVTESSYLTASGVIYKRRPAATTYTLSSKEGGFILSLYINHCNEAKEKKHIRFSSEETKVLKWLRKNSTRHLSSVNFMLKLSTDLK
jgi:hypothetical protein